MPLNNTVFKNLDWDKEVVDWAWQPGPGSALSSTKHSTQHFTLAEILSIWSDELLRYWVISSISCKMLPTNLIWLDNPP